MRAIAAFMVYISHNPFIASTVPHVQNWFDRLLDAMSIGVSIFFVLSGFLITLRYANSIQFKKDWIIQYVTNRFARIYPLYFIVTIITFVASQLSIAYDPSRVWKYFSSVDKALALVLNLTLLRGFFANFIWTLAGQGWSLTVEECFYLAAPIILFSVARRPKLLMLWPLLLIAIGVALVGVGNLAPDKTYGFFKTIPFMLFSTFFGRSVEFVIGMALALFVLKSNNPQVHKVWATGLGIVWILGCAVLMTNLPPQYGMLTIAGVDVSVGILIHNFVLPVGIAALFWGLIHEHTWFRNLLETKLFDLLGKSSYAFYLLHVGVLNFFVEYHITENAWIKFIIMNLAAIAVYKLVEHPMHSWLVKWFKSKSVAHPVSVREAQSA
jgi:peptidoglycan/LPS O-acetylase OafA/YrhL